MKVLSVVVICCGIYSVSCYGPPPKSKKGKSTTTTEAATSDDGIIFPGQENNVNPPVSYIQNSGVGSYGTGSPNYQAPSDGCAGGPTGSCGRPQGQPSYNPQYPQGQQPQPSPQQPGGNYLWQGGSSYPQQQPPTVPSQSPGNNLPPQNVGQAPPPNNPNQQGYAPTHPGSPQNQPAGGSPPKPIDIHNNPFLSSALGGNKPSSCGSYGGGACNPQAPNQGVPPVNSHPSNQPVACRPGGCIAGQPPHSQIPQSPQSQTPLQPGLPSNTVGSQPVVASPSKPIDINNNPFLSSALNKPSSGCTGSYSGNCGANQPQIPQGQNQYPIPQQPGQQQPQYPSQYPGSQQPVNIGQGGPQESQSKPLHPGLSQIPGPQQPVQPQYPGSQQPVQPQYPGSQQPSQPQGNPQYPGSQQQVQPQYQKPGQFPTAYPESQPQLKPQGGQQYPGNNQYPGSQQPGPLGSQQLGNPTGGNQYPSYQQPAQPSQGSPQSPDSSYQGLPQGNQKYPGSNPHPSQQPGPISHPSGQAELPLKYPGPHEASSSSQNPGNKYTNPQEPGQQPGGQYPSQLPDQQPTVNIPGSRPQQYPNSPSQVKPSYPQYGSGPIPGQQYTPQFPDSGVPCNQPNQLCVTKSACQQGVLTQNGVPGRAGFCNVATEVCCKIPTGATPEKQAPPTISYGTRPGTNGIPIGGSIYDTYPKPSLNSVTPAPTQQPYTGPLNTTPYPGCPAALKCVPITYCTAEGVMADNPVYLTREQQENRVPLTDCMNLETNIQGKCCRDPNYKDPWPAGMMMGKTPDGGNVDDGQYHPPATDNGQYHSPAEQETSGTFSHEAGLYYNVPSSTQKAHTIKKPIGNFNQNPTAFPTKPAYGNGAPVRQPAPVHEKEYPDGVNPPSNEILPPNGDTNAPINPDSKLQPGQVNQANKPSYQLGQTNPIGGGSYSPTGSAYQPVQPNQLNPNEPVSRPDQPSFQTQRPNVQPLFQPNTDDQLKQPGNTNPSYQPGNTNPSYQTGQPDTSSYQPSSLGNEQPAKGFPIGQPRPGSSCGIRHQAYTSPEDAGFAEFPWQALVSSASNKTYVCGAAIIAENAVITAAHCVEELRSKEIVIKAGEWKLLTPSEKPVQVRPAAAVSRHPQFSIQSLSNDLAIIVISQAFTFDDHVDKICLPSTSKPTYDQSSTCVVTGWGRKQLKGLIPGSVLHKVDVTFIPQDKCESNLRSTHLGKYFILNKGFSCALPKNPSDLCKVDVGSPIACDRGDGHYELAGVNSWDVGCQTDQMPTISSNPDAEWIEKVINTPAEELAKEEEKYFADKLKGESIDEVDIDQKPGFALGYGK